MKILVKEKLSENQYKTPEGYLVCQNAILARTGPQDYYKSEIYLEFDGEDELISVDRKSEQVFNDKTLSSFENKPVTNEHPNESVTVDNYKNYAIGYVRDVRKSVYNSQDVIIGNLVITDPTAISEIESKERYELSCGYDCDITEGDNPEQINIRGNHVALCKEGRAGIAKIRDSYDLDKKEFKKRVRKILSPLLKPNLKEDYSISDILQTLEDNSISAYVEKIYDYKKDPSISKDYLLGFNEYPKTFMLVTIYMNDDYVTNEVNAYFTDSYLPSNNSRVNYNLKDYVKTALSPEFCYETDEDPFVVAQFPSENSAKYALKNSPLKNVSYDVDNEDGLYLMYFDKDVLVRHIMETNGKGFGNKKDSNEFSKRFYKESLDILKKKYKKLNEENKDELDDDVDIREYNKSKRKLKKELENQMKSYLKELTDSLPVDENSKIRDWYLEAYPKDDMGEDIKPNITFYGLYDCLNNKKEVYAFLGVEDSVIRERCFEKLSEILHVDYDYIYKKWLKSGKRWEHEKELKEGIEKILSRKDSRNLKFSQKYPKLYKIVIATKNLTIDMKAGDEFYVMEAKEDILLGTTRYKVKHLKSKSIFYNYDELENFVIKD